MTPSSRLPNTLTTGMLQLEGLSGVTCRSSGMLQLPHEGLQNMVVPKPGEIWGGCSGGTIFGPGVTPSGLADRSEGSGHKK